MFTDFRERKRAAGGETDRHRWVASCTHPDGGLKPQPMYVPCFGLELANFGVQDNALTNWTTWPG